MGDDKDPAVLARARDLYAVYCASSDGKNYQGLPCPAWDELTEAVRGHWYTVVLRTFHLAAADAENFGHGLSDATVIPPSDRLLSQLPDAAHALEVWQRYSGATT